MSLVLDLTRNEFDSLRSEIAQGRRDHILKTLDERGGAQELIRQQYSGRYPIELLQNAADAAAEIDRAGRVRFELTDTALLVADNGVGFGPDQVRAICSLGRTSKDPSRAIGYKGLGFKSVGEISERPQVLTGDVLFEFDSERVRREVKAITGELDPGQRLPAYAFPFALTMADLGDDQDTVQRLFDERYTTVMRLPFGPGIDKDTVRKQVEDTLRPQLMLFLTAMERLELAGTATDFTATVARDVDGPAVRVLLEDDDRTSEWLVYTRPLPVDADLVAPLGDMWRSVTAVSTSVAVPLRDDGAPDSDRTFPLHVYFPTEEEPGFAFIASADWALHLDRRQIATTPESATYNNTVTTAVVRLVTDVVAPDLLARFPGTIDTARVLVPRGSAVSGRGALLRSELVQALGRLAFVPTTGGQMHTPGAVQLLPANTPPARAVHRWCDFTKQPTLVIPDVEEDATVRAALPTSWGTAQSTLRATLAALREPSTDDPAEYYRFVLAWDAKAGRYLFSQELARVRCVRTQSGQVLSPSQRVLFPRRLDAVPIPPDLPLPIAVLPEVDGLESLLRDAGVKDFGWRQLVLDFLVPILTRAKETTALRERAFAALRAYFASQRSGDQQVKDAVARVLVPCRDAAGKGRVLRPASEAYFGSKWTRSSLLEDVYGPFGKAEFVDWPRPAQMAARTEERDFLAFLGVSDRPRVLTMSSSDGAFVTTNSWGHPHHRNPYWNIWWDLPDVAEARHCPQGHRESQVIATSHVIDRFAEVVSEGDTTRLRALWTLIARAWPSYRPALTSQFYCRQTLHTGERARECTSLAATELREAPWVPAILAEEYVAVRPREAWQIAMATPLSVARRVPILDHKLLRDSGRTLADELGVADIARPQTDQALAFMLRCADEQPDQPPSRDLAGAARWAMRALNDALRRDPEAPTANEVPLLCRRGDVQLFHPAPIVAKDPLLREAWSTDTPVFDGDTDLDALFAFFGLKVLDDNVRPVPRADGEHPERSADIARHVAHAAPWLLSIVIANRPSAQDEFIRRLGRLDFRACDHLTLSYRFEDVEKRLSEAASYIAERNEEGRGAIRFRAGTAYLELDPETRWPSWYSFGPQLAAYLGADAYGDVFGSILATVDSERDRILAAKRISRDDVRLAAKALDEPLEDEFTLDELVPILPTSAPAPTAPAPPPLPIPPQAPDQATVTDPHAAVAPNSAGTGVGTPAASAADVLEDLPPLALAELRVQAGSIGPARTHGHGWRMTTSGPSGPARPPSDAQRDAWGERGERAALAAERNRVSDLGLDPNLVVWTSRNDPYASHDIESVDIDGLTTFIEVKSTPETDPTTAFHISAAQLLEAMRQRSKYVIYRVTDVRSIAPPVYPFPDPIGAVLDGRATLDLADARMSIGNPPEPIPAE